MKHTNTILLLTLVLVSFSYAVRVKRDKIETKILNLPKLSVEQVNYNELSVEYSTAPFEIGTVKSDTNTVLCLPKGSTKMKKFVSQYLKVPYKSPEAIVVAKDASGKVIYAEKFASSKVKYKTFGKSECAFVFPGAVHKAWEQNKRKFIAKLKKEVLEDMQPRITKAAQRALFTHYSEEEFELYYFTDKTHDYSDLTKAYNIALEVYEKYETQGHTVAGVEKLKGAIAIWKTALNQSNIGDKDARINHKVTIKLHSNLAVAFMYINDYKTALLHFNKIKALEKSVTNSSRKAHFSQVKLRAIDRIPGVSLNESILQSDTKIKAVLKDSKKHYRATVIRYNQSAFSRHRDDLKTYNMTNLKETNDYTQIAQEEAVASGAVNPYEKEVIYTALQGYAFHKTPLMALGEKYTEIPVELCKIERINQILIPNNSVSKIPAEIRLLKNLKVLNLKSNNIKEIPEELSDLQSIESINLADNAIKKLPDSIGNLKTLKKLNLKGNPIPDHEIKRIEKALPDCRIKI